MSYNILDLKDYKLCKSEDYNYIFDKQNGNFARWGKTQEDDPVRAPFPEIIDIEIATACDGIGDAPCAFCSPPGTLVNTPNGEKPIETIVIGDTVYSVASTTHKPYLVENRVHEIYSHDFTGELVEIIAENGSKLLLTPDHIVICKGGIEKPASALNENDELIGIEEFKRCLRCDKLLTAKNSIARFYCSELCFRGKICPICKNTVAEGGGAAFCRTCIDWGPNHLLKNTYQSMIRRCYDSSRVGYEFYGGKGIKVCQRWHRFENFLQDMGERPNNHTLDRIDSRLDYSPENCRWVSVEEQRVNRTRFKNAKSKYKGVLPHGKKWVAKIKHKKQQYYLGSFDSEKDAAIAINTAMKQFYPETFEMYINRLEE
jgi:hypothetical protein